MNRISLLRLLEDRERQKRDEALLQWQEAQRQAEGARTQAQALQTYLQEYQDRWAGQFKRSAPIEILRCYHGFVDRLNHAIGAQQHTVAAMDDRLRAARERLTHREVKLATVQRLIERRLQAQAALLQRREQKATDEAAQRLRRAGLHLA